MDNTLLIDIGNSAVKWLFNGKYYSTLTADFSVDLLPKVDHIFVACVGDRSILEGLNQAVFVDSQASFGQFKSAYEKPQDLGIDRFLAMITTVDQYPSQNNLIIDAGSALTFDLVLKNGEHQGGLIMPGLGVLRRSFTQFQSDSKKLTLNSIASNTEDGWEFGTANMFMNAIEAQIEQYNDKYGDLRIVLTGGDAKMITYRLNQKIELKPNLVLNGLALYTQSI